MKIDTRYFLPSKVNTLLGDITETLQKLGWAHEITVQQICKEMVAADYKEAKRHALFKANGHAVNVRTE